MERFIKCSLMVLILSLPAITHARLVRIIHTNDLHSYFTGYFSGEGGYARVASKIKEIREASAKEGIEVIHLDAGDWGEGTSFYHANEGVNSIRALGLMGIDIATIGNHDHMMGGLKLGHQIREANIKTKFTVANVRTTPDMDLKDIITPYVDIEKAGIPIRVIGLTTSQIFFQYTLSPGKILSPQKTGEKEARRAKKAGRELVIALTHIGLKDDRKLARRSTAIDLIVGGHSHTKMDAIYWETNRKGKDIPIVQAWAHGLAVGSLLVEVPKKGQMKILEYKLHEIDHATPKDPEMHSYVKETVSQRDRSFPLNWYEEIGISETPLSGYRQGHPVHRSSCWGHHMATAAREAVGATVGVHASSFEGVYKPPGPVTYGDIADQFPHFRNYGDAGWEIATIRIAGWQLRPIMYIVTKLDIGVTFSGLGYKKNVPLINDKAVYTLAFPAEVAYAIRTSFPKYAHFLKALKFTGQHYWPVVAEYVKRNSPISCR